ncbi:zinc-ribbon domain-containing protein [Fructilactobacillus fructivorans]|uniref:Zinc-ribbon domain-containing protein n=1 Tax=Fructilactobacillus fructivorans TaxID=1614 RepID=A0A0C1M7D0_9LACO|nr:zinc ribbon domain-containing protein [Fructilactobacillus fructivorans]KID42314.1 hypothetical protein LfDm3_0243 [Fructilactobacillus fructivorans]MCT0151067.1 zinc ribbon domain-containing protein [Fructilactobacillus fructivorans]MCT2867375.1 zinc ribbon domain-containing protein [Fructilactobacillus fructivorans]MCT2869106.1 zinc ribbon domain-containing protein [Fructilactobacillus fructivorans]MCT2873174.1 zinc ribbon domain-containing protein [Fructilactobacillus fructivorans]
MDNIKFCVKCGKKIGKDVKFCPYCGAEQPSSNNEVKSNHQNQPNNYNQNKGHSTTSVIITSLVLIVLLLAGISFGGYKYYESRGSTSPNEIMKWAYTNSKTDTLSMIAMVGNDYEDYARESYSKKDAENIAADKIMYQKNMVLMKNKYTNRYLFNYNGHKVYMLRMYDKLANKYIETVFTPKQPFSNKKTFSKLLIYPREMDEVDKAAESGTVYTPKYYMEHFKK